MRCARDTPANDATGVGVDHEGHIDEPGPGADVGEVGEPEHVRRRRVELAVHMVERARRRPVRDRRLDWFAADHALEAETGHQALNGTARDRDAFAIKLPPDLARAIDFKVLGKDALNLRLQSQIPFRPIRQSRRIGALGDMIMVGRGGDRQHVADRLDPVDRAMIVDERNHVFDRRSSSATAK
jgi:hypothetical protein